MIDFPLHLPIEATSPREIILIEASAECSRPDLPTVLHDHFHQLRIEVTPSEAIALRAWLARRNQPEAAA